MGWLFGRSKGRHALGAAVRGIPAGPVLSSWGSPVVSAPPVSPVSPSFLDVPLDVVEPAQPAAELPPWSDHLEVLTPPPAPASPVVLPVADLLTGLFVEAPVVPAQGPRGEMTFRDGTTAELDPEQARALDEIAQLLTGRDGVKH